MDLPEEEETQICSQEITAQIWTISLPEGEEEEVGVHLEVHQTKENSEAALEEDQIPIVATEAAAVVEGLQRGEVDTEVTEVQEVEDKSKRM